MQQQADEHVKQLLNEARHALEASNAQQALECVAQALTLLHGDNAVLPALRAAAERYHAQRAAPFDELAQLLAQVSIAAQAQGAGAGQQQQQYMQPFQAQHPQQQQQQADMQWQAGQEGMQQQAQQMQWPGQQPQQAVLQQQLHQDPLPAPGGERPILEESGRGSLTEVAMADGSSWRCPHCSGVVPMQRQEAHLAFWCPASGGS